MSAVVASHGPQRPALFDFIGEDGQRGKVLRDLMGHFDALSHGKGPILVSIEGEAGIGKTRIVQELYGRLVSRDNDGYWPRSLVPGPGDDLLSQRKRVQPGAFESDRLPTWVWWGVSCQLGSDGEPIQALADDQTQLHAHCDDFLKARIGQAKRKEDLGAIARRFAGLVAGFFPVVSEIEALISAGEDLAEIKERAQRLIDGLRATRRAAGSTAKSRRIDPNDNVRESLVDELEALIVSLGGELPFVIALDDAHEADESAVALVRRLLSREGLQVLVVTTCRLEGLERRDGGRGLGTLLEDPTWQDSRRVHRHRLKPFGIDESSRLIDAVAPQTDAALRDALIARAGGNPLVLRWILTLERVKMSIREGAITLSLVDIADLPATVGAVFATRWDELATDVRGAMAFASVQGRRFLKSTVVDTARSAVGLGAEAVEHALLEALRLGVVRCTSGDSEDPDSLAVYEFANEADVELAQTEARGVLRGSRREAIADTWRSLARSLLDGERAPEAPRDSTLSAIFGIGVRLASDPRVDDLSIVRQAASWAERLRDIEAAAGLPHAAISTEERRVGLVERLHGFPSRDAVRARLDLVWLSRQLGAYQRGYDHAIAAWRLSNDVQAIVGADDADVAQELAQEAAGAVACLCCDRAGELRFRGDPEGEGQAQRLWEEAVAAERSRLPSDDHVTSNLAIYYRCIGTESALHEARTIHTFMAREYPEDQSLGLERNLTVAESEHGQTSIEAVRTMLELADHYMSLSEPSLAQADYHYRRAWQILGGNEETPMGGGYPLKQARAFYGVAQVERQRRRRLQAFDALERAEAAVRRAGEKRLLGEIEELRRDLEAEPQSEPAQSSST